MLCFSHRLYFMALGRIFALQYILRLETLCVLPSSFSERVSHSCLAGALSAALWCSAASSLLSLRGLRVSLTAPFLPSLLHPTRGFCCAPDCPVLPYAIWPFSVSPCKACQETSRAKVREGAVADWSINACRRVICTTADVAQAANKVLVVLHLTILLGGDLKPIPTQINRFLPICISSFPYGVRTDYIQQ